MDTTDPEPFAFSGCREICQVCRSSSSSDTYIHNITQMLEDAPWVQVIYEASCHLDPIGTQARHGFGSGEGAQMENYLKYDDAIQ